MCRSIWNCTLWSWRLFCACSTRQACLPDPSLRPRSANGHLGSQWWAPYLYRLRKPWLHLHVLAESILAFRYTFCRRTRGWCPSAGSRWWSPGPCRSREGRAAASRTCPCIRPGRNRTSSTPSCAPVSCARNQLDAHESSNRSNKSRFRPYYAWNKSHSRFMYVCTPSWRGIIPFQCHTRPSTCQRRH